MFAIKFTTITPLVQIENGADTIEIKRMPVFVNVNGSEQILKTPIYTANGFRGALRRTSFSLILEAMQKKGIPINSLGGATNFHLHNAGGGNNYGEQSVAIERKVRELSPHTSVFGASLAVEGKLIVQHFVPMIDNGDSLDYCYYIIQKGDNAGQIRSSAYGTETIVKKDAMLDHTDNALLLSDEEIEEWKIFVSSNNKERTVAKENKDADKVKKATIRHIQACEYIPQGIDLYGAIEYKMELTDIEKGLLIRSLEKMATKRLGGRANTGNGKVAYSIEFLDGCSLTTRVDKERINMKVELSLNKEGKACVKAFDEWLEQLTEENIQLDKVLV